MRRSVIIELKLNISVLEIFQPTLVHRSDIEADRYFHLFRHAKEGGHLAVALAFSLVHRLGGQPVGVALPRLDLYEMIVAFLKGNDIRLAVGRFVVAGNYLIAVLF